jgi:hypothetical protein
LSKQRVGFFLYLHVSELREGLVAVIQLADERLESLVGLLMGPDIAALSKSSATLLARKGTLSSVTAHMGLISS